MIYKKVIVPALGLFLLCCTNSVNKTMLKSGDFLFCSYEVGELSGAIAEVTKPNGGYDYSHMGIVEIINNDIFVIHASLKRGVIKETLESFLKNDQPNIVHIYRLINKNRKYIQKAISKANKLVGLPYNYSYLMNDSSYYCSQLIYDIFKEDTVFELEPMTFKNPGTNEYNKGWINYYRELDISIPEGEPGCNPNGLANSGVLKMLGKLN